MEIALALSVVSVLSIVVGLVLLPIVVVRLDEDHFTHDPGGERWQARSLGRRVWAIVRTAIGIVLVLAGIVLLFLPGQGVLTIVAGLLIAEYPGKYRVERAVVRRPRVLSALNAIRRRFERPPLRLDGADGEDRGEGEGD